MPHYNHISVAVPAMDELDTMPLLIESLKKQSFGNFDLYVCVNNPDDWWNSADKTDIVNNNIQLINLLNSTNDIKITIIDKCTKGNGWTGKKKGVGMARKLLFDRIIADHNSDNIIVSMDADTTFGPDYLQSIIEKFNTTSHLSAMAVPYYHPLSENNNCNRAILRYELYMRYYMLQLLRIRSPYAFTALGSAMAFTPKAYNLAGGITPLEGGEDFYLMQKFCKTGLISISNTEVVYPSSRTSHRVPFGTGPAVNKGITEQEKSYPFYPSILFDNIKETFYSFDRLYQNDYTTPMTVFLQNQLKTTDIWLPLRKNYKKADLFVKACTERVDGLRILQYLKQEYNNNYQTCINSEIFLKEYCHSQNITLPDDFSLSQSPIGIINDIRNILFQKENTMREEWDNKRLKD